MAGKPRLFSPLATALTLVVVAVCLSLSWWQWQRADEKREWLADQSDKAAGAPLSLSGALSRHDRQHLPIAVSGELDNARPVLLDNRMNQGIAGYYLLSPLRTADGRWVLINRGWLPRGNDRAVLPAVAPVTGPLTVKGTIYEPSSRTLVLKDTPLPDNQWPLRVQKVDFAAIGVRLGVELAPFEIRLAAGQGLGDQPPLPKPWQDAETIISPQRHEAYALQWLGLAVAALAVFLVASRRQARRQDQLDL
ncbi:hypothetical protein B5T_01132 [Alloalcanivorax dieselolei B5]|uniref:SURF1-like protein n=1 Tax=Alcanivorax dieselolei (strain DSM 16502 / CGMCC 1.3690 / MCCC 1A00001 / B-5) TaxID=930169 RepID=K0CA79_ALCDB|nr:SURF1 family protein [Alloalcanivorax dieselolei]AFT69415.1 hypothetical protein B5T_01132 [Alloalcanivorax dieselolei B5]GGJ92507.1 SURF1-like protein [Alloalcanivorax dieselolei]